VPTLRVALIAPPTVTVPPTSLGGLDQVRWLAQGLAGRGHHVTLIGADLGGPAAGGYAVIDTDPTGGERASAEIVDRLHAEHAGKIIEYLGTIDVVGDHTCTGWLPAGGASLAVCTVQTSYRPLAGSWKPACRCRKPSPTLTCGLASVAEVREDPRHGVQTPLLDLLSAHRLARAAGPPAGVQERRDPRATARGRGLAPTGRPAATLLAGPGHPFGMGVARL
jgi:hypothetical protein